MARFKFLVFIALAAAFVSAAQIAPAQIGISIGVAPACPYGYYDYAPYNCSPYGYYGPDWFSGGIFVGAGPWYHGHHGYYGHVDNRYDPHHGYVGPMPERGAQPFHHFNPNEARDGQGHVGTATHSSAGEHSPGAQGGGHSGGGHGGGGGGHH